MLRDMLNGWKAKRALAHEAREVSAPYALWGRVFGYGVAAVVAAHWGGYGLAGMILLAVAGLHWLDAAESRQDAQDLERMRRTIGLDLSDPRRRQ